MSSYPNAAEVNPDSRPLPPGWISQFDANYRAWYYVDTTATPPKTFWQHPADLAPPPPPAYSPPSGPPPTGGAVAIGGVGGFAFPTPQGPTSPGDGKIPTYGGNTSFPEQQVYPAAPGTADHKPAHVGAQYSGAPTGHFDTKTPSSLPTSPQSYDPYQSGQYGQNPDPYQSQYGQQAPGQYGQQPPAASKGDKGGLGGLLGGIMGAAGKHGGGSSGGKMGKLGALGGLAGLAGGKLAGGSGGSHGSSSSSPFGKLAGFAGGGSHGSGSHGYGHGGYAAAPMMYGKPAKKKGGMGGAGMLAAGAGAGLLGGLLVADAVDDAFDDDYGGGGDFGDFGDF